MKQYISLPVLSLLQLPSEVYSTSHLDVDPGRYLRDRGWMEIGRRWRLGTSASVTTRAAVVQQSRIELRVLLKAMGL